MFWLRVTFMFFIAVAAYARVPTIDQAIENGSDDVKDASLLADDNSVMVELDMRFTYEQWGRILDARRNERRSRQKRKALRRLHQRWNNGVIPYSFSDGFSESQKSKIRESMEAWASLTCLSFRPADQVEPSVTFVPTGGCSSHVGKTGMAGQPLTLGSRCIYKGIIMHELGHAFGFIHEHSRPDRDDYVTINYQNAKTKMHSQFKKFPSTLINTYNVPYDYKSLMHYGPYYFTANGEATISTKTASAQNLIGNRYAPSFNDIHLANVMYTCAAHCDEQKSCPDGFQGKDCRCWCKGPSMDVPLVYCGSNQAVGTSTPAPGNTDSTTSGTARPATTRPSTTQAPKPTAGPVTPIKRKDLLKRCPEFARNGHCTRYPTSMQYYCSATCAGLPDMCRDLNERVCPRFMRFCGISSMVRSYCKRTCGICSFEQRRRSCIDVSSRACHLISVIGNCQHSNKIIRRNAQRSCPFSCGLCNTLNDGAPCADTTPRACSVLKAQGRCNSTSLPVRQTLRRICAKTCNLCPKTRSNSVSVPQCVDRISVKACQQMARANKCTDSRFQRTMSLYCRRTCNKCFT